MPAISVTLEENNSTIMKPAYYKVVSDIAKSIKLPSDAITILYDDIISSRVDTRTTTNIDQEKNIPVSVSAKRILATITEDYNEDDIATTSVHQLQTYPIFIDEDIQVYIYPIYVKTDVKIEFTYVSPSRSEAMRVRDIVRTRLSQSRNVAIHDIEYTILVPECVQEFIADVHELKSRLFSIGLAQYFKEHATNRAYLLTDTANTSNSTLGIYEKQIRIAGIYDFSGNPDKVEIDNDKNNYRFTFNYSFTLDVPRGIVMRYPVMICNRTLPSKWLSFIEQDKKIKDIEDRRYTRHHSYPLSALSYFEAHRMLGDRVDLDVPINIPAFDEFTKKTGHVGYGIAYSFLVEVDETDHKTVLDLKDLGEYKIEDYLLEFIRKVDKEYVCYPYRSFIYIGLHQDTRHHDDSILELSDDLILKSKVALTLTKPVRVTISICIEVAMLDIRAIDRLLKHPKVLLLFISEYVRALRVYAVEIKKPVSDTTFFNRIIYIIHTLLQREDYDSLKSIFNIISRDKYTEVMLARVLHTLYKDVLRELKVNNIIDIDKKYTLSRLYMSKDEAMSIANAPGIARYMVNSISATKID